MGLGLLEVPQSYSLRQSSRRVISPLQRPLPDNTHNSHKRQIDIRVPGEIQTRNPSKWVAVDPCFICQIYIYIFFFFRWWSIIHGFSLWGSLGTWPLQMGYSCFVIVCMYIKFYVCIYYSEIKYGCDVKQVIWLAAFGNFIAFISSCLLQHLYIKLNYLWSLEGCMCENIVNSNILVWKWNCELIFEVMSVVLMKIQVSWKLYSVTW